MKRLLFAAVIVAITLSGLIVPAKAEPRVPRRR